MQRHLKCWPRFSFKVTICDLKRMVVSYWIQRLKPLSLNPFLKKNVNLDLLLLCLLALFLIYSYIVDVVLHGEGFVVGGTTIVTTNR